MNAEHWKAAREDALRAGDLMKEEIKRLLAVNEALRQALGWMRDAAVHGPEPSDAELQEVDRLLTPNAEVTGRGPSA